MMKVRHFCLLLSAFCLSTAALGADCTAISALACGTTGASLSEADCTASDNSQYRMWQFSGKAGDSVTIEMHSTAFDTFLALLDPAGMPVADNDDSESGVTDSKITLTLTTTGTWTVVANSLAASQSGNYTLSLSCPSTAVTPRQRAARH
ncbi:MAG TPA: PPC domain-containing protein [Thermoanaerobaculia bacterium]|nr:PPC domain-containing protein [Thermoanaerobaculia bacterium]